ncbi:MAG TPA: alpha-amylase family glycosyl hydrolase [Actinomycetota bacterium]
MEVDVKGETAAGGSASVDDWWRHGVVYQIYPRSFQEATGDGVGDLPGILQRLDHLNDGTPESLGVDAVWLSPFYPSPMADFGYDVADHCDVDPLFGTLADFDDLVDACHRRGIRGSWSTSCRTTPPTATPGSWSRGRPGPIPDGTGTSGPTLARMGNRRTTG